MISNPMTRDEALKILNIDSEELGGDPEAKQVMDRFETLFEKN